MSIKGIFCILIISILSFGCESDGKNDEVNDKPNIVFLIADDMGYGDIGCYGGISATPNVDRLASNGLRFTDFYAAAPNCSPSRAGLMTGRSPARVGMYSYRPPNHPMHLRDSEITIAEVLKNQGYQTAHIGKWHLGCLPQDTVLNHPQPHDQGFDYSLGTENNAKPSHLNPVNFVRNGKEIGEQKGYSCQILADEAVSWFNNYHQQNNPFFMYVAFHEPHSKVASPPELVDKYSSYPKKDAEYLANIENLDLAVGKIVAYLEENGLMENTLIFFSSDNGSYRQASNGDFRAVKSYLYEGGIRVPGIIHWSGLPNKGLEIHEPAGFVDMMPTVCEILNIQPENENALDGTSILPVLQGMDFQRQKPLFWYFYRTSPEIAMRMDNYMILGKDNDTIPRSHQFSSQDMDYIKTMDLKRYELYNVSKDQQEVENLIEVNPKANAYKQMLDEKLRDIQATGYLWDQLPATAQKRKVKTDWVKY